MKETIKIAAIISVAVFLTYISQDISGKKNITSATTTLNIHSIESGRLQSEFEKTGIKQETVDRNVHHLLLTSHSSFF
jgi:hypothetical protein